MGQKQTFAPQKVMSALPPKADMCGATDYVCFGPKADQNRYAPTEHCAETRLKLPRIAADYDWMAMQIAAIEL